MTFSREIYMDFVLTLTENVSIFPVEISCHNAAYNLQEFFYCVFCIDIFIYFTYVKTQWLP